MSTPYGERPSLLCQPEPTEDLQFSQFSNEDSLEAAGGPLAKREGGSDSSQRAFSGEQRLRLLARMPQRFHDFTRGVELHGDLTLVFQLPEFAVNIKVVDLPGARFMPSGHVRDMYQSNLSNVALELFDQISERALLVVDVVKDPDVGAAHSVRNLKGFGDAIQVDGWALQPVDRFDHGHQTGTAKYICGTFQRLDRCCMLTSGGGSLDTLAGKQNDLLALQPLDCRNEAFERREKRIPARRIRETRAHAGRGIHTDIQCLHARENTTIVLLRPFLELPHKFHMVVAGLCNPFE